MDFLSQFEILKKLFAETPIGGNILKSSNPSIEVQFFIYFCYLFWLFKKKKGPLTSVLHILILIKLVSNFMGRGTYRVHTLGQSSLL